MTDHIPNDIALLRDRYVGCLLGQCLGDALGFVVEGHPPATCGRYVRDYLRQGRAGELGRHPFPFGQYSDDSQLARELLQSYVRMRGFSAPDYAAAIARIFSEGRIVGRGRATEAAATRLQNGLPWWESGTPAPAAGNGSAMRAGVVGLLEPANREELARIAHQQGLITHADPRCSAGSVVVARAVALALDHRGWNTHEILEDLADLAAPLAPSVASAVLDLGNWLELPPEQAVAPISRAGMDPDHRDGWQGISPFVTSSITWSLYSFLRNPDDYMETISTAIAVGGDVDTTAAMAGAMAGARNGARALPRNLVERLNDRGTWDHLALTRLATEAMHSRQGN